MTLGQIGVARPCRVHLPDKLDVVLAGLLGILHQLLRVVDGGHLVHLGMEDPHRAPPEQSLADIKMKGLGRYHFV
jgi:hypothetical protein